MRFLFWNVRGLGKESRKRQVKDFIKDIIWKLLDFKRLLRLILLIGS
jgi:hypothetical protein